MSFRIRSSQKSQPQNAANFGFGTLADWLSLAAAPTFAIMALLTGVSGGREANMLCAAGQAMSPFSGMAAMYLLMSAFHLAPWLKLVGRAGGQLRTDGTSQTPEDAVARPQRPGAK
jgi:hypothetical protein